MRPRGGARRGEPVARAFYSVAQLASIGNVSRQSLWRLLKACDVRFLYVGRTALVPLSEIQGKIPPLWETLVATEALRQAALARPCDEGGARPSRPSRTRSPQG